MTASTHAMQIFAHRNKIKSVSRSSMIILLKASNVGTVDWHFRSHSVHKYINVNIYIYICIYIYHCEHYPMQQGCVTHKKNVEPAHQRNQKKNAHYYIVMPMHAKYVNEITARPTVEEVFGFNHLNGWTRFGRAEPAASIFST